MIEMLDYLVTILTILYAVLLMAYRYWFSKLSIFKPAETQAVPTKFSIVIPARNEAANIKACVDSILAQDYPSDAFEIIVMDDFSEDDTAFIVEALHQQYTNVHLLKLADYFKPHELTAFKKKAIEKAVSHAKGDWIITTDADCKVPSKWLSLYHAYISKEQPVFVAAPVMFIKTAGVLNQFQILDFLALQGITAASVGAGKHSMSNGANLAFEKAAFIAVGGYQGVDHIASGDDMFLMHKMKKTLAKPIGYLFHPDAIVLTDAMPSWRQFIMQRIRWSSKARYYDDRSIFWVLLLVYLFNLSFLLMFLLGDFKSLLIALAFKTFFELFFLDPVAQFFHKKEELRYFPLYQPIHIVYNIVAGLFGQIKTYTWKGRKVK
ncbi:MAG: glycosyltransferase [Bacteroidota bacterium]|nr:glycosyltransferase [Bacteroidota bacterium]